MKTKLILAAASGLIISLQSFAQADSSVDMYQQKPPHPPKIEEKEIIIKDDHGKKDKTVIIIDNGKVTINGKPVDDMKGLDKLQDMGNLKIMGMPNMEGMMAPGGNFMFSTTQNNKAVLGVATENNDKGAKITSISKESPAEKAGLKTDDIITKVDTITISNPDDLHDAIGKYKPGDNVNITFLRGTNTESTVTAKLGKNKDVQAFAWNGKNFNQDFNFPKDFGNNFKNFEDRNFNFSMNPRPRLGVQIQDLEEGNGVKVTDVNDDSPAAKAGLKENDIITSINGTEIKNVDDVRAKIKGLKEGDSYEIKYKRDGKTKTVEVKIPKKLKTADL